MRSKQKKMRSLGLLFQPQAILPTWQIKVDLRESCPPRLMHIDKTGRYLEKTGYSTGL